MTCNHQFKYKITHVGAMDYGGPIIVGTHNEYLCEFCGKRKMIMQRHTYRKIWMSRKENTRHYQLGLL